MTIALPTTVEDAVRTLAEDPGMQVLAGGTDFMVEVNYSHRRPRSVLALRALKEVQGWHMDGKAVVLGAGLTYTDIIGSELAEILPALAQAARTVGSPQIRNSGTIGGNVATASPAGDTLPVLVAMDAVVTLASLRGERRVPIADFIKGVKSTVLEDDELIVSLTVPGRQGPQEFLKIGKRNAMVIAVASVALTSDIESKTVACALGSVGPTVMRCPEAEDLAARSINWDRRRVEDPKVYQEFGALCAEAALPIDDHRSSAAYRQHSVGVMAQRALERAF